MHENNCFKNCLWHSKFELQMYCIDRIQYTFIYTLLQVAMIYSLSRKQDIILLVHFDKVYNYFMCTVGYALCDL